MSPAPSPSPGSVFSIPAFRRLWMAQFVSVFGDFLAFYAASSFISFRLHGSPRQVTMIMVAFLTPFALVGPIAGVFVDRWDARRTMVMSDVIRAALVLSLLWAGAPWQIYSTFAVLSVVSTFFIPAQSVTTPIIVPKESLLAASAAMQQTVQAVRILSPAVAGALAGWLGERSCYALDSVSFAASALLIGSIALPHDRPHMNKDFGSVLEELNSGLKYVFTHAVIGFIVLALAAGTFAISAFGSLLAVYVRDVLHAGPYIFGATGSMVGVGMLAGSIWVAKYSKKLKHPARLVVIGVFTTGVFVAGLAGVSATGPALAICIGVGLGASLIIVPSFALLQSEADPDMRGRVMSISMALLCAAQAIAVFFAGDVAARLGIVFLYYGSAILLTLIAAAGWIRLRQLT